jgi:hypothetical protein
MLTTIRSSKQKLAVALSGMVYGAHLHIWDELEKLTRDFDLHVYIDTWDVDWNVAVADSMINSYKEGNYNFNLNYKLHSYTGDEFASAVTNYYSSFSITDKSHVGPVLLRHLSSLLVHKFSFDRIFEDLGADIPVFRTRPAFEFKTGNHLLQYIEHSKMMILQYGGFNKRLFKEFSHNKFFLTDGVSFSTVKDSQYYTFSDTGKKLFNNIISESIDILKDNGVPDKTQSSTDLAINIGSESKYVEYSKTWMLFDLLKRHKILFSTDNFYLIEHFGKHSYKVSWPDLYLSNGKLGTYTDRVGKLPVVDNEAKVPLYSYLLI